MDLSSDEENDQEDGGDGNRGRKSDSGSEVDEREQEAAAATIDEQDALETRPMFGGIGSGGPTAQAREAQREVRHAGEPGGFQPASFVSSRRDHQNADGTDPAAGTGVGRAGLGTASASSSGMSTPNGSVPASFGAAPVKRSFLHGGGNKGKASASQVQRGTNIKFGSGLGGGFNPAEALAKMGWAGGGLGKAGEGIVNPIDVQLRPEKAGIAFGGRKELTEKNREEARRRGQKFSDDDEEGEGSDTAGPSARGKGKGKAAQPAAAARVWTQKKPRKPRIEHRTYDELIESAGALPATDAGVGQIIDATGREMREVTSIASALSARQEPTPTSQDKYLPELRHNIAILCEQTRLALEQAAIQGAEIRDKQKWIQREIQEAERRLVVEEKQRAELDRVIEISEELDRLGEEAKRNEAVGLKEFDLIVERIQSDHREEIRTFGLDEALVAALAPVVSCEGQHSSHRSCPLTTPDQLQVRRITASWEPLKEPTKMLRYLKRWTTALCFQADAIPSRKGKAAMTQYEALLWHFVMPCIRTAINNDWDVHHPSAAIALMEAWKPVLPRFILDNIADQLLLPKLKKAIADWNPRSQQLADLQHFVFAWLPVFPPRAEELLSESKRRFRSGLKAWKPSRDKPRGVEKWRTVFKDTEWEALMLEEVVPKLGPALRADLTIDPSNQELAPLERFLQWSDLLRDSVVSRILEKEFFPKWLDILHMWLTQPSVNLGEVAQWYSFWSGWFPTKVSSLPGVARGFRSGLDLMNQAMEMADPSQLKRPDFQPMSRTEFAARKQPLLPTMVQPQAEEELSFRTVVEDAAAAADLLIQPLNRVEPASGAALLRISRTIDGKRGVNFYILDNVLWAENRDAATGQSTFLPVEVQELFGKV